MRRSTGLLFALIFVLALPGAAQATTFEVTRNDDPAEDGCVVNGCSLREALSAANAVDGNAVHVPASATPYTLSNGHFAVTRTITVQGDGAGSTTISGDADNRIFTLTGVGKTLTITGLTLSGGHAPVSGGSALGGAIEISAGTLDIQSSILTGNVAAATTATGRGGAIDLATPSASVSLTDSAVTGNQATSTSGSASGGGVIAIGGSISLVRSSVTGNTVSSGAAGATGGGITAQGPLTITNSTIANNNATTTGTGISAQAFGGGISTAATSARTDFLTHATVAGNSVSGPFIVGGNLEAGNNATFSLQGSIVADGTGAGTENCGTQGGSFSSLGSNLEDRNQCGLAAAELRNTAPGLLGLGSNGGIPLTMAIPFGSPARNAGGSCGLGTDARGLPRTGPCDIGAFEYQPATPVVTASGDRATALTGQAVGFSASATDADAGDTVSLAWSFDDGAAATGASVSHAFATAGSHTATITATDTEGLQATAAVVVTVSAPTPAPAGPGPDTTAPGLSGLAFAPSSFPAAGSGPSVKAAARKPRATGAKVSFRLTEAATVTFTVERATSGRRVRGRCVKPTRANRTASRCTRFVALAGSFTHIGKAGANTFRFTGRMGGRKLAPGSYRLVAGARDAAGNRSQVARKAFRIVR